MVLLPILFGQLSSSMASKPGTATWVDELAIRREVQGDMAIMFTIPTKCIRKSVLVMVNGFAVCFHLNERTLST